jgi:hypothetical protein
MKLAWHSDYGKAFPIFCQYMIFWIYLLALLGM